MPILEPGVTDWSILLGWRGSRAWGTADEESDKDLLSVCVPPIKYYMGLETFGKQGSVEYHRDEWDVVVHECRKFFRMMLGGSPDGLAALWLHGEQYMKLTGAGALLLQHRELFLSRSLINVGFGFVTAHINQYNRSCCDPRPSQLFNHKDAMHCVRTLQFLTPILGEGAVRVKAADPVGLLRIKNGYLKPVEIHAMILELRAELEAAYIKSPLPDVVDVGAASELCAEVINAAWDERRGN